MKLKKYINQVLFLLFIYMDPVWAQTILIDPGHGGEEIGAVGFIGKGDQKQKVYEKDIALELAKKIQNELKKTYSTFLTRSFDRSISLDERAELAEKLKADLIISVHLNSYRDQQTNGFETYYLDNHKNVAVRKVESIENKGLKGEDLVINQILIDLVVEKTVKTSQSMADLIHKLVKDKVSKKPYSLKDRKVRPGMFYILALSKRPGVLLEAGYITNQKDLQNLINPAFQEAYAQSVAEGVRRFFQNKNPVTTL